MADDREKISTGPNEEPINETIAGTGPGIPDDGWLRARSFRRLRATSRSKRPPRRLERP